MPRVSEGSKKCKPGRKGNFRGQRLQFLETFLPDWETARQNRTTGDFWSTVISAYWKKFHWRLQWDEDLSVDNCDIPADDNLTEEELAQKAAAIRLVETVCTVILYCDLICEARASDANPLPFSKFEAFLTTSGTNHE
jgi:hypothetical protein